MSRAALLAAILLALPADAEVKVDVRLAWSGSARLGQWTAVRFEIENTGETTELALRIEGREAAATRRLPTPGGSRRVIWLPVKAERRLRCVVVQGGKAVVDTDLSPALIPIYNRAVLVVAEGGLALPEDKGWTSVTVVPGDLPDISDAFDPFDAVVVRFPAPAFSDEQSEALRRWTLAGGRLAVCAGIEAPAVAAGPLGKLLPASVRGVRELKRLTELDEGVPTPEAPFPIADFELRPGAEALPLGAVGGAGKGRCAFFGFDPMLRPVADWGGLTAFWKLHLPVSPRDSLANVPDDGKSGVSEGMSEEEKKRRTEAAAKRALAAYEKNVREAAEGDLRRATDLALAGQHVAVNWFFGLLVAYLAAIGPFDYFVLKRLGRLPLTWATLPVAVVAFSAAAYALSWKERGQEPALVAVGTIDVFADGVRETAVYSAVVPQTGRHAIVLDAPDARLWPAPGEDPDWKKIRESLPEMESGAHPAARNLPAQAWTPYGIVATVDLPAKAFEIRPRPGATSVHAPATLRDCRLHLGARSRGLGDLEPGAVIRADDHGYVAPRTAFEADVVSFLIPRQTGGEGVFAGRAPSDFAPLVTGWLDRSLAGPTLDGRPPVRALFLVRIHLTEEP
ncbi:MAG: hypothetical protein HYY18_21045 [Planctomycetes bacterium]|nr:hypothetical protein [Planctomycetota bacterium]